MSRNRNRNAKKKLTRNFQEQAVAQYFSLAGSKVAKPDYLATFDRLEHHLREQYASQIQQNWQRDLAECATKLGSPGCWAYFHTKLHEARTINKEREFREMVVMAAGRFQGRAAKTSLTASGS